jgi:hypothetical protein
MVVGKRGDNRKQYLVGAGTVLLVLITLEASLLGSGRLLQIGALTMKMWLFAAAQIYTLILLVFFRRLNLSTFLLILSFSIILCIGATMGLLHRSDLDLITQDVKPLLFCFLLMFVEMTMRTVSHLQLVIKIIKAAALIITAGYALVLVLLLSGLVSFPSFYDWMATVSDPADGDFMFRGESGLLFYKGSLYIAIGLIFFVFDRGRKSWLATLVAIAGLVANGSRGFFFAIFAIVLVHALTGIGGHMRKLRYFVVPCAGLAMLLILLFSGQLVDKQESDHVRITTASQVMDRITPVSIIFGNGFGVGVEEKPTHMEDSFLEIFHKQGLLGFLWWGTMYFLLIMRYRKVRRANYEFAQPLFLSACFVAFESLTNPFINNPIGIFVLLIVLVGLDVLSGSGSSNPSSGHCELALS